MSSLDLSFLPLLEERSRKSLLRASLPLDLLPEPLHFSVNGHKVVNFSSNDYLGLTRHPRIIAAAKKAADQYGVGAGASPLITGQTDLHHKAALVLAKWERVPCAKLLPSGYQTAFAIVQTLSVLPNVRFLIDKLTHASLIDAVRATGAEFRVFPHNSVIKLRRLLEDAPKNQTQVVATESMYSMDGDEAPLAELAELKKDHPFIWVLDEAHGTGVYGPDGTGLAAERNVTGAVDIKMVTFSKALGIAGGAILSTEVFCQAVENFGRAYIYSTAVSPMIAGALIEAIAVVQEEPWRAKRTRQLALKIRESFKMPGDSPIIPIILNDESKAMKASRDLMESGFWVAAIRPPTVAKGTSRLRLTISASHSDDEAAGIVREIQKALDNN